MIDHANATHHSTHAGADPSWIPSPLRLTAEQTQILYNLEYLKARHDTETLSKGHTQELKRQWIAEWQLSISEGFPSFVNSPSAQIQWCSSIVELKQRVKEEQPQLPWFRSVLLETMLFAPYYPLRLVTDRKGNPVPDRTYQSLQKWPAQYSPAKGDEWLNLCFAVTTYTPAGYLPRLRKSFERAQRTLGLAQITQKDILTTAALSVGAAAAIALTAGALAPGIAVALVGSNFAGLSGAALTSASLAYLGGGAIAAGGAGMAGGTAAIVGGGALLGLGAGGAAGAAGTALSAGALGKEMVVREAAKLIVSVREILLNDEHDSAAAAAVLDQLRSRRMDLAAEKSRLEYELRNERPTAGRRKELREQIERLGEQLRILDATCRDLNRFLSSFCAGAGR